MTISDDIKRICRGPAAVLGVIALAVFNISACATRRDELADNAAVIHNVCALLDKHAELDPPNVINVETRDHVVYLSGFVSARCEQARSAPAEVLPSRALKEASL